MKRVVIDYTSYRGIRRSRVIMPINLHFGSNEWHKIDQWFLEAKEESTGEIKFYAMSNIHRWDQVE